MDPAALRVLIALEIRKLILPSGITNTLDELKKAVKGAYNITEDFSLQYKDSDFNDFFTLTSTDQIQHKDTIKVVFPAPIVLTLFAENEENFTASTSFSADELSSFSSTACSVDDAVPHESTSYVETVILSLQSTPERMPWPQEFPIPSFSPEVEILVKKAMEDYNRHGSLLNVQIVKKDINEEFRRITTLHLESTFMKMLDLYTPKLLAIFTSRGGALGWNLKQKMDALLLNPERNIDMTRAIVLRCLICYLGEKEDNLIQEYNCDNGDVQQDVLQHIMKIAICKGDHQEDISINLEGWDIQSLLGSILMLSGIFGKSSTTCLAIYTKSRTSQ
ncbi:hypothetical protein IRJ41_005488 [Triplophysa rosa]|uniref:PB1 domain-containing protein n=1 Tax=Triplophysa rosa TaxID=992332 RepID=A0A9W7T5A3_TRIRA|nr:hypothetical protein IRJ41_005488 [Triplophysa rosa]